MASMDAYKKIMEHIKVDDAMRDRVLQRLREAEAELDAPAAAPNKTLLRFPRWKQWTAAAACFAILLAGAATLGLPPLQPQPSPSEPLVLYPGGPVECASLAELSERSGVPLTELSGLPFSVEEETYLLIGDDLAEIQYQGDGQTALFRRASGDGDISGDYNAYAVSQTVDIGGASVLLKGSGAGWSLALWTKDGYACSLSLSVPADQAVWTALIQSAQ